MLKISSIPSAKQTVNIVRNEVKAELRRTGDILLDSAIHETPYKDGRARRGWTKTQIGNTVRVANRVPYIEKLERNYSKQTEGRGIMKPAMSRTIGKRRR
jgi:hypothetical protein|tara:strand:- start:1126 stop:1425 length:300 start_codon:yes stop_codon:yes gene_type:complete